MQDIDPACTMMSFSRNVPRSMFASEIGLSRTIYANKKINEWLRASDRFEMLKTADGSISGSLKVIESLKNKKKNKKGKGQQDGTEWTWKEQVDLVKYSTVPIEQSLLRLDADLSVLAVECFLCLMRYMGDQPLPPDTSEVKCVYTILMVRLYMQRYT